MAIPLHALDTLVKKIYEKRPPPTRSFTDTISERGPMFLVDVNDYRSKQDKRFAGKGALMAERARQLPVRRGAFADERIRAPLCAHHASKTRRTWENRKCKGKDEIAESSLSTGTE